MAAGSTSQPSPPLEIDCSQPGQSNSTFSSIFLIPQALQSSTSTSANRNITTTHIGDFIIPLNTTATPTPNCQNKVSHKTTPSEVVKGQPTYISYADMVKGKSDSGSFKDPDVPIIKLPTLTSTFQGKPSVLFQSTAKSLLVKRLKFVLVGKFSHGRPSLRSVKLFFVKLHLIGDINITVYDNKHIFLECSCMEDFYRIWLGLTWFIEGLAMRVFKWFPDFSPLKESSIAPVWINVAGLPLYMFEKSSLMAIAEVAGPPIRVDPRNINRSIVNTAWICIELDVQKPLVEDVWVSFLDESGKEQLDGFWIKFSYTVVPPFCSFCQHIGHQSDFCKRKTEQIANQSRLHLSSEVATEPVADAAETAVDDIVMEFDNGEAATGDVFAAALEGASGDGTAGTFTTAAQDMQSSDSLRVGGSHVMNTNCCFLEGMLSNKLIEDVTSSLECPQLDAPPLHSTSEEGKITEVGAELKLKDNAQAQLGLKSVHQQDNNLCIPLEHPDLQDDNGEPSEPFFLQQNTIELSCRSGQQSDYSFAGEYVAGKLSIVGQLAAGRNAAEKLAENAAESLVGAGVIPTVGDSAAFFDGTDQAAGVLSDMTVLNGMLLNIETVYSVEQPGVESDGNANCGLEILEEGELAGSEENDDVKLAAAELLQGMQNIGVQAELVGKKIGGAECDDLVEEQHAVLVEKQASCEPVGVEAEHKWEEGLWESICRINKEKKRAKQEEKRAKKEEKRAKKEKEKGIKKKKQENIIALNQTIAPSNSVLSAAAIEFYPETVATNTISGKQTLVEKEDQKDKVHFLPKGESFLKDEMCDIIPAFKCNSAPNSPSSRKPSIYSVEYSPSSKEFLAKYGSDSSPFFGYGWS